MYKTHVFQSPIAVGYIIACVLLHPMTRESTMAQRPTQLDVRLDYRFQSGHEHVVRAFVPPSSNPTEEASTPTSPGGRAQISSLDYDWSRFLLRIRNIDDQHYEARPIPILCVAARPIIPAAQSIVRHRVYRSRRRGR